MDTDTIAPIAVITVTSADKFFNHVRLDDFVVVAAEVLTVALGAVLLPVPVPVPVLVTVFVTGLVDTGADGSLMDSAELPLDAEGAAVGVTY
jgi:hypothetical protein